MQIGKGFFGKRRLSQPGTSCSDNGKETAGNADTKKAAPNGAAFLKLCHQKEDYLD
ncbi:hypothetical protein AA0312_1024 [Acetobacter tropicalis NRIC 0312]|uniref:Uncharacterized protein n=1 Tax=Acetobacter tropicalis TaxID=104102 RepID=A0A511FNP4_9PROT|nr:hypothetical protein ATR1_064c0021 [Acetobacter tropicalis]GBR68669.1 hypothetical protein AA0312_1024 [Acetobacter tropicalis NRIC 0312]GEL50548.1 hypothetical protein ATR01nite_16230 [Acetobacter tropicalis]